MRGVTPTRRPWSAVAAFTIALAGTLAAGTPPAPAVVLTDAAGRTVELDELPARLLVVGDGTPMVTHLLAMFPEGLERLVALEKPGRTTSTFLPLIAPDGPPPTFVSHNPGPEQIVGIRPDLVLARGVFEDQTARSLAQIGIPVAYLGLESPERFVADVRLVGGILGRPDRAERIADYYTSRMDRIERALADLPGDHRPRVLLAMAVPRGDRLAVQVPARGWMQTRIVERSGGRPVWLADAKVATGWTVVTIEQVASWDPDWIFIVFWHSEDPEQALTGLAADRHWAALAAVRAGRLRAFPGDLYGWDLPDPRWILGFEWTAATLHPERFPDYDPDIEVERFFRELYGMDPAAIASSIRPAIRMDLR